MATRITVTNDIRFTGKALREISLCMVSGRVIRRKERTCTSDGHQMTESVRFWTVANPREYCTKRGWAEFVGAAREHARADITFGMESLEGCRLHGHRIGVIPKARVLSGGPWDLARTCGTPREIPRSAEKGAALGMTGEARDKSGSLTHTSGPAVTRAQDNDIRNVAISLPAS